MGGPLGIGPGAMVGNYADDKLGLSDTILGGTKPAKQQAPGVRPYAYEHTGTAYKGERAAADAREGYKWNWGQADEQRGNALQSRGYQSDLAQRYRDRIDGKGGPSLAEQQLRMGQETNMRGMLNAAASTRGGGGAALAAQAQACNQGLVAGQQLNAEAAMMRTKEQQDAEAAYAGLLNNMRGADMAGSEMDMRRQGMMADEYLKNRQINDARSMGLLQGSIEEQKAKMAAEAGVSQLDMQGKTAVIGANAQADAAAAAQKGQIMGSLLNAGGTFAGAYYGKGGAGAGGGG